MNKRTDMMKITVTSAILQMHLINKCTNLKEIKIFTQTEILVAMDMPYLAVTLNLFRLGFTWFNIFYTAFGL